MEKVTQAINALKSELAGSGDKHDEQYSECYSPLCRGEGGEADADADRW